MAQSLTKVIETKRALEELATDKGWLLLGELVQEQADQLQQEVLFTPCTGIDSALGQEYKKGMLEGRLSWENLRQTAIENCNIDIDHLRSEEDERDSEPSGPTGTP